MRRIVAAAAVGAAAVLAFAAPAQAEGGETVCPSWTLRSITGTEWGDAADGAKVIGPNNVQLAKPQGGGTEFATADAGIDLAEPADITVNYTVLDGASTAAGAIRLFYYKDADADTFGTAPTAFGAAADEPTGTITVPAEAGHVGTLGLVYDASNSAGGKVKFTQLKVGGVAVKFTDGPCEVQESPSPSASPSATRKPTATPTTPAAVAGVGGGQSAGSLPVTGASVPVLGGVAALLLVGGGAALVVSRRRRTRFTA